jgi:hypothetical protein
MKVSAETLNIEAEVRQENGNAERLLRAKCAALSMSRTQVIRLYGDPRQWPERVGRKVRHRVRGECLVTAECLALQRYNPDKTSMFVELEGEVLEVTKQLVDEIDFTRASGDCVCDWCGKKYYDHPRYVREQWRSHIEADSDHPTYPLRELCDGRLVKL